MADPTAEQIAGRMPAANAHSSSRPLPLVSVGARRAADNLAGRLPQLIVEAGFRDLRESARFATVFAIPICLLHARRP